MCNRKKTNDAIRDSGTDRSTHAPVLQKLRALMGELRPNRSLSAESGYVDGAETTPALFE
jgi:hypothetical protein